MPISLVTGFLTLRNSRDGGDAKQMSVSMLLRRSPDLDIENLGGMNLVSSSTMQHPDERYARSKSPEPVVSNDQQAGYHQHLHIKAVPRPRPAVAPQAVHLSGLTPLLGHADDSHTHSRHAGKPSASAVVMCIAGI